MMDISDATTFNVVQVPDSVCHVAKNCCNTHYRRRAAGNARLGCAPQATLAGIR
jgi:hypothetical protein